MCPVPESSLSQGLREVHEMVTSGHSPAQCAVVFRSLANEYPHTPWLREWAGRWEALGSSWLAK